MVAVEGDGRLAPVLPRDLVAAGVDLDDTRERGPAAMRAVVEQQHAAIRQPGGMMLVRNLARPPLPREAPRRAIDDAHGIDLAETHEEVAVRGEAERILVEPLITAFERADAVGFGVEGAPHAPLPHRRACAVYLADEVAVHGLLDVPCASLHAPRDVLWHRLETDDERIAVRQSLEIVMRESVPVRPDDIAVPVQFEDAGRVVGGRHSPAAGTGSRQQMAVVEQESVRQPFLPAPLVAHPALHIDEEGLLPA